MLDFYKKIENKNNSNKVFIIGGGLSLLETIPNPEILNIYNTIACNNAFKLYPNSIVTHFVDNHWYDWNKEPLSLYKGIVTKSCHFIEDHERFQKLGFYTFQSLNQNIGITDKKYALSGLNCGHQAINLAIHIGFKEIILCGFDMDGTVDKLNWHSEHLEKPNPEIYNSSMLGGMNSIAEYIKDKDIKIFNINKDSKITCFPYKDLKECL